MRFFRYMFADTPFNQPIGDWDTSSAATMREMFENSEFNQDISSWNTATVEDFGGMFLNATSFNQDISNWKPSSAKSMKEMFYDAELFDQNLCAWGDYMTDPDLSNPIRMFSGTACPRVQRPDLDASPISPLCYACS